jgi:hypothetical protein
MPAWLAGWAAQWRTLREGAWLPRAAAIGQWTLVATVTLAIAVQTAGYLGRLNGSGRLSDDLGALATGASLIGFVTAAVACLLVAPVTWVLLSAARRRVDADPLRGPRTRRAVWRRVWWLAAAIFAPPVVGLLGPQGQSRHPGGRPPAARSVSRRLELHDSSHPVGNAIGSGPLISHRVLTPIGE